MTSLDDAVMEFRTRGWLGWWRRDKADLCKQDSSMEPRSFSWVFRPPAFQFIARQGIEIPESRVHLDTTVFHTYKIVKHGDVSVDMFVTGS